MISREDPLPGRIAQHRNGVRARRLVRVQIKRSTQDRADAQHGEEVDRHERHLGTLRAGSRIQFDGNSRVERDKSGERAIESLVVQILWIAERHSHATVLGFFAEIEQPTGLVHGEGPKEQLIGPREECRGGAETKREGQNGRRREPRLSPEQTCGVAQIPP